MRAQVGGKAERGGSISQRVGPSRRVTIAGVTLAADGPTSVSWVPYQMGCPILLLDLKTDTSVHAALSGSIDVQNVSSDPVEEITLGALAGPSASGTPKRLVASQTIMASIAPGERRRISLQSTSAMRYPRRRRGARSG